MASTCSLWGADSRVVKSIDCGARGPGFESRCRRKVLGSDGIICKYLPLWVCPEFGMCACSLFRFVLIELRHWGEPSAVLLGTRIGLLKIPVLNLALCLVLYTCFAFYCISAVLRDRCWFCCSVLTAAVINEHYYYYYILVTELLRWFWRSIFGSAAIVLLHSLNLSSNNFRINLLSNGSLCLGYSRRSEEYSWCAATTWSNLATHKIVAGGVSDVRHGWEKFLSVTSRKDLLEKHHRPVAVKHCDGPSLPPGQSIDDFYIVEIAQDFVCANDSRSTAFGNFM